MDNVSQLGRQQSQRSCVSRRQLLLTQNDPESDVEIGLYLFGALVDGETEVLQGICQEGNHMSVVCVLSQANTHSRLAPMVFMFYMND